MLLQYTNKLGGKGGGGVSSEYFLIISLNEVNNDILDMKEI